MKDTIRIGDPEWRLAVARLRSFDRRLILGACDDAKALGATSEQLAPFYGLVFLDTRPTQPWMMAKFTGIVRKHARKERP